MIAMVKVSIVVIIVVVLLMSCGCGVAPSGDSPPTVVRAEAVRGEAPSTSTLMYRTHYYDHSRRCPCGQAGPYPNPQ